MNFGQKIKSGKTGTAANPASSSSKKQQYDPLLNDNTWGPYYVVPVASILQTASLLPFATIGEKGSVATRLRSTMVRSELSVSASLYNNYVKSHAVNEQIADAQPMFDNDIESDVVKKLKKSASQLIKPKSSGSGSNNAKNQRKNQPQSPTPPIPKTKVTKSKASSSILKLPIVPPVVIAYEPEYDKAGNAVNRRQKKNRKRFRLFLMVSLYVVDIYHSAELIIICNL